MNEVTHTPEPHKNKAFVGEGEDEHEFSVETGEFVIVDSSVLDGIENPLIENAVFVPVKSDDVVFTVKSKYDESVLQSLEISPKFAPNGNVVTKDYERSEDPEEVSEGVAGQGHDSTIGRKRHTMAQKRDNDGRGAIVMNPDPGEKIKQRVAQRTGQNQKRSQSRKRKREERSKNEDIILNNIGKPISEMDFSNADKKQLLESMDLLMAMALGGWSEKDGKITNGKYDLYDGRWGIEDGFLCDDGSQVDLDFDWLYDARNNLKTLMDNEHHDESAIIVEAINARRRQKLIT